MWTCILTYRTRYFTSCLHKSSNTTWKKQYNSGSIKSIYIIWSLLVLPLSDSKEFLRAPHVPTVWMMIWANHLNVCWDARKLMCFCKSEESHKLSINTKSICVISKLFHMILFSSGPYFSIWSVGKPDTWWQWDIILVVWDLLWFWSLHVRLSLSWNLCVQSVPFEPKSSQRSITAFGACYH